MKAIDWILSQTWAMEPDAVAQICALAERTTLDVEAVMSRAGRRLDNTRTVEVRDGVAVIPVHGVISRYANMFTEICGGTSVDILAKDIRTAVDDPNIRAVVLDIDSPGGQAAGIGELAAQIREGTGRKPIVSYVSNHGASAAYWIASAGSEVVAAPSALLGSVGAVLTVARNSTDGKTIEFVSSQSPMKRRDPSSESGRAALQASVDDMAAVFIDAVAEYRDKTPDEVMSDFGQGGMLIGSKAVAAGMADRLGSLEGLISELSQSHGGPAGGPVVIKPGGAAVAGFKGSSMKFNMSALFKSWLNAGQPAEMELAEAVVSEAAPVVEAAAEAAVKAAAPIVAKEESDLAARLAQAEATIAAQAKAAESALMTHAEAWFKDMVKAEKLVPAEKPHFVAAFVDAAKADASNPLEALANVGGRLGMFKQGIEKRPRSGVTTEMIPTDPGKLAAAGLTALDSQAATPEEVKAKASAERVNAMLAATEAGADLAKK